MCMLIERGEVRLTIAELCGGDAVALRDVRQEMGVARYLHVVVDVPPRYLTTFRGGSLSAAHINFHPYEKPMTFLLLLSSLAHL